MNNGVKLEENYSDELKKICTIDDFLIGSVYSNNEIASTFKCSNMGGMRRSLSTNSLVLIAKHDNPLYDDQWTEKGILNYTGMGTVGNQDINFGQNKTLASAKQNGIKVYLFESFRNNEYYYCGEVELCGSIYTAYEVDKNGNLREVLKFPLRRINESAEIVVDVQDIKNSEVEKRKIVRKLSQEEIKSKIKEINSDLATKKVTTVYRERNQFIAEYIKNRAAGICDLCNKKAPFMDKNGEPYLEEHHVIPLADGGPDVIYNTVAICPNCHKKVHILKDKQDMEKLKEKVLNYLLEDDEENVIKYNELFGK